MSLLRLKDVICCNHRFDHRALLFAALALAGFASLPMSQAVAEANRSAGYGFRKIEHKARRGRVRTANGLK
jgi:hypothetical protein